jgi:hypothetical protein
MQSAHQYSIGHSTYNITHPLLTHLILRRGTIDNGHLPGVKHGGVHDLRIVAAATVGVRREIPAGGNGSPGIVLGIWVRLKLIVSVVEYTQVKKI